MNRAKDANYFIGERYTFGTLLQTLSSLPQQKKLDIRNTFISQENALRVFKQHRSFYPEKTSILSTSFDSLSRSLKEQVESDKTKPKEYEGRRQRRQERHHYQSRDDFSYWSAVDKGSYAMKPYMKEQDQEHNQVQNLDSTAPVANSYQPEEHISDSDDPINVPINCNSNYSRHLSQNNTQFESQIEENDCFEDFPAKESQETGIQRSKICLRSSSTASLKNTTSSSRKKSQPHACSETREVQSSNDDKIEEDKVFVSSLCDPSLKDSLQEILKRRKSTVCLFKTANGGLKVLNENEAFQSAITDEQRSDTEHETTKSECSFATSCKSVDETKLQQNMENNSYFELHGAQTVRHRKGILRSGKKNPTTRKCNSAKIGYAAAHKVFNPNKVETEETKMIRPLSVNIWRPSLVPKRAKKRSNTAYSCPETPRERTKMLNKTNDNVIRDFIIMYAKVKSNKMQNESVEQIEREIRMISQTPEFVVKGAIGQFLTSTFPSNTLCVDRNEEKYETKQKTRLLKIKNCMQQLANLA